MSRSMSLEGSMEQFEIGFACVESPAVLTEGLLSPTEHLESGVS